MRSCPAHNNKIARALRTSSIGKTRIIASNCDRARDFLLSLRMSRPFRARGLINTRERAIGPGHRDIKGFRGAL